ncbi:MAG: hypothetical protein JST00_40965 [Deltaproteobacteria bacterium]|nr:hypothetical protein [Deltaproteobacteria bacterium]
MCCFSGPVRFVGQTHIFARALGHGRQALVYGMTVEAEADVAMILPLPVPPGTAEDDVSFVDLSEYPELFDDLQRAFPPPAAAFGAPAARPAAKPLLSVKKVGAFEASFVPSIDDFERLDPRFQLPDSLVGTFPGYADHGFAVFQLAGGARAHVHPMAFTFPRRDPAALFFPTVHVHDGVAHPTASFDHQLYCQWSHPLPELWWRPGPPASHHVDVGRALGLVDGDQPIATLTLIGERPNEDVWIR